jgi:hypothetical protein
MIKNKLILRTSQYSLFTVQALISSLPAVIVLAFVPQIIAALNLSTELLGITFLLYRLGAIAGGLISPVALRLRAPHVISTFCELCGFIASGLLLLGYLGKIAGLLLLALGAKGILSGLLAGVRFSWLRNLPDVRLAGRSRVMITSCLQATYGIGGVLLMLTASKSLFTAAILVDGLTCLVGAFLFWQLRSLQISRINDAKKPFDWRLKTMKTQPSLYILLISDILMAVAMGGTNMLVVKYSNYYLVRQGGYPTGLILYSIAFLTANVLYQKLKNERDFEKLSHFSPWILGASFLLFYILNKSNSIGFVLFSVILFAYPIYLTYVESAWFATSDPQEVAKVYAVRYLIISIIWAFGELFYAALDQDFLVRGGSAVLASIGLTLFLKVNSKKANQIT